MGQSIKAVCGKNNPKVEGFEDKSSAGGFWREKGFLDVPEVVFPENAVTDNLWEGKTNRKDNGKSESSFRSAGKTGIFHLPGLCAERVDLSNGIKKRRKLWKVCGWKRRGS